MAHMWQLCMTKFIVTPIFIIFYSFELCTKSDLSGFYIFLLFLFFGISTFICFIANVPLKNNIKAMEQVEGVFRSEHAFICDNCISIQLAKDEFLVSLSLSRSFDAVFAIRTRESWLRGLSELVSDFNTYFATFISYSILYIHFKHKSVDLQIISNTLTRLMNLSYELKKISTTSISYSEMEACAERIVEMINTNQVIISKSFEMNNKISISPSCFSLLHVTIFSPDSIKNKNRILIFDLSIEFKNSRTLIVGPSGSGKTSIVKAMAKISDFSGTIILPESFEIIPQNPVIVSPTLRQFFGESIDFEQLYKYAKFLKIDELVSEHFDKYNTLSKWAFLTPGEKQRLFILRALLTHPRYLIMDESTSALDVECENQIYNQLNSLNIIYISISHNIVHEYVKNRFDQILTLRGDGSYSIISTMQL